MHVGLGLVLVKNEPKVLLVLILTSGTLLTLEETKMMGASYKTKKDLKAAIGEPLRYVETSFFGPEYKTDGKITVVGPCAYTNRKWYATVTMVNGLISKVS